MKTLLLTLAVEGFFIAMIALTFLTVLADGKFN